MGPIRSRDTTGHSPAEIAYERFIKRTFSPGELPSLIGDIFPNKDKGDTILALLRNDPQALIDVMDEALETLNFSVEVRKDYLKVLYRTCGLHTLLPTAMHIPVRFDRTSDATFRGGCGDVWKGEFRDREVAVKVIRTYSSDDLKKIASRFCKEVVMWKALRHPNVVPLIGVAMSETRFAMISEWMVNRDINNYLKENPDVDRLKLLIDATRGLIYMHSQRMVHGDLKGANVLIDHIGRARLVDFGLLTIMSDPTYQLPSSSYLQGGTIPWMGPELFGPQKFGLEKSRPTKYSDRYALGMVIYETLSGHRPFHKHGDFEIVSMVLNGARPTRDVKFADALWKMLQRCWKPRPSDRPNVEEVLRCLEGVSGLQRPPSPPAGETATTMEEDGWSSTDEASKTIPKAPPPRWKSRLGVTRKCSSCGLTGHRNDSERCPKYAPRVTDHPMTLSYIEPPADPGASHSNVFDSRMRLLKKNRIRGSGN